MKDIDKPSQQNVSDEDLLLSQVFCGEADLLYLDVYLGEVFRREHN